MTQETALASFGSAYLQSKPELDGRSNMTQTPMYQPNSNPKQGYYELAGQLHRHYNNAELPG